MSSREQQKAEKRLKDLLKLPDNKRCVNCEAQVHNGTIHASASLAACTTGWPSCPILVLQGPQYAITDFNIFVCTVCSGVQ